VRNAHLLCFPSVSTFKIAACEGTMQVVTDKEGLEKPVSSAGCQLGSKNVKHE
jgi:hypothetical protein